MVEIMMISIGIYILSCIWVYKFIQKEHSKGGPFENINPGFGDVFLTFTPIVNTIFLLTLMLENINLSKFFNIKK